MCLALGLQDDELQNELLQLSKVYRSIEPSELGDGTAKALQKANVTSVSLIKTGDSSKMQVDLPERFEKPVEDNSIDSLSFDKQVTLDVEELADGTVLLKNIRGLKLHAKEYKMWVNLLEATIKPEDPNGAYPAEVTAGKMGVTKTVTAVLPHSGFEPLAGILKQLRAMSMPQALVTNEPAIKLEPSEKLELSTKLEPSTKPEPSTKLEPSTTLEPFLPVSLLRHPVIHNYGDVCIFVCDH
jgi:hypothetical protein